MSDLTDRVKRAYSDQIINGAALTLTQDDAALLGAYAFMKSVVADHATPKDERFYPQQVRERFRQTLFIPPNVRMWIAAYQGVHRFGGRCHTAILSPNEPSVLEGIEYYAFTYVVGHLVLQTHRCDGGMAAAHLRLFPNLIRIGTQRSLNSGHTLNPFPGLRRNTSVTIRSKHL
jgi:hypothetical protein